MKPPYPVEVYPPRRASFLHSPFTDHRSRPRLRLRPAAAILASHLILLAALALSLTLNVRQARQYNEDTQVAYAIGYKHGAEFIKRAIILSEIEREFGPQPELEQFKGL